MDIDPEKTWYLTDGEVDLAKLHLVAMYMADAEMCDTSDLVTLIEKPWNHFAEYKAARDWQNEDK